jgi:hypothetical protein
MALVFLRGKVNSVDLQVSSELPIYCTSIWIRKSNGGYRSFGSLVMPTRKRLVSCKLPEVEKCLPGLLDCEVSRGVPWVLLRLGW